jgi:hypothetical protein
MTKARRLPECHKANQVIVKSGAPVHVAWSAARTGIASYGLGSRATSTGNACYLSGIASYQVENSTGIASYGGWDRKLRRWLETVGALGFAGPVEEADFKLLT